MLLHTSLRRLLILLLFLTAWTAPLRPALAETIQPPACGYSAVTAQMLSQTSQTAWATWVAQLSGASPIVLDGIPTTITTRYSYAMFDHQANARAYDFVLAQAQLWYPADQIEQDEFRFDGHTWKNLVLTLPGSERPEEVILLTAHLDSTAPEALKLAPGAEDNASGTAALLEAARLWRSFRFERTLRLIWFTGEEQGLVGSRAYVQDHDVTNVKAVINMDMFGYDSDNDRCFELHAGTLPASKPLVDCFESAIQAYDLDLRFDRITAIDMRFSDHSVFWDQGIGAVLVLENHMSNATVNGCKGVVDSSPHYHSPSDTLGNLNLASGFAIAQAGLAAAAGLAGPMEACFDQAPQLKVDHHPAAPVFSWQPLPGVETVRLLRSQRNCGGPWEILTVMKSGRFTDHTVLTGRQYAYRLEAWNDDPDGVCVSLPADCIVFSAVPTSRLPAMQRE